ncbi:MAG: TDP-N-acetylfucosamine:lipid II N-acetylfucosaminyltransferase [Clostridia bacterium]|nr:TDP-N-acetylfucosamine:lipid II N-acetylfucosaminyltransferase [Clostridia bacterium]
MKVLHIIQLNERNSYNLFKQWRELYDLSDHTFLVVNNRAGIANFPKFAEFEEFLYLDDLATNKLKLLLELRRMFAEADRIIVNSLLFVNRRVLAAMFYLLKPHLKKTTWIEWGADLYNWYDDRHRLLSGYFNRINRYIRENVESIGLTFEYDVHFLRETIHTSAPTFFTPLPFGTDRRELLESTRPRRARSDGVVWIQVAHNALMVNKHVALINKLERFSDENARFIMPLSYGQFGLNGMYGGWTYSNAVKTYASRIFGSKATFLTKSVELEHYLRYMWNVDIAVFHTQRPIALASIYYMTYMGKKIFVPSNTPQYAMFLELGIPVFDTLEIPNMTFEEFTAPVKAGRCEYIVDKFEPYREVRRWEELFEHIGAPLRRKEACND